MSFHDLWFSRMKRFYDEIWFHVAGYFISLKSFARFWWSTPHLVRSTLTHNSRFWMGIIRHFCEIQYLDFSQITGRIDIRDRGIYILRSLHNSKRCSRSGCYQMYTEWDNNSTQCMYHPGRLRAGGHLSCCRGKGFTAPGCKAAFHDGAVYTFIHMRRQSLSAEDGESISLPPIVIRHVNDLPIVQGLQYNFLPTLK